MEAFNANAIDNIANPTWNLNLTESKNYHVICLHIGVWCLIIIIKKLSYDKFLSVWENLNLAKHSVAVFCF